MKDFYGIFFEGAEKENIVFGQQTRTDQYEAESSLHVPSFQG